MTDESQYFLNQSRIILTVNVPMSTKVVCFYCLLKYLRSLNGKQCGSISDLSYRSSLFWVNAVSFYTQFVSNVRQFFAADDFSRCHFQMHFFLALCARLFICVLWSPAGKGLTSWLSFVVSNCEFVTFPLVSWVRCGT